MMTGLWPLDGDADDVVIPCLVLYLLITMGAIIWLLRDELADHRAVRRWRSMRERR